MDTFITTRVNEEKKIDNSKVVSKFLEESASDIDRIFERIQIEDDRNVILEIQEIIFQLGKFNKEMVLTENVKNSVGECLKNLQAALRFNTKQYGPFDEREPIKNDFEKGVETFKYPRSIEDLEQIAQTVDTSKKVDASVTYLNKTNFAMDLISNHGDFNEHNQSTCDQLREKCRNALKFNLGLYGNILQRNTPPTPSI